MNDVNGIAKAECVCVCAGSILCQQIHKQQWFLVKAFIDYRVK